MKVSDVLTLLIPAMIIFASSCNSNHSHEEGFSHNHQFVEEVTYDSIKAKEYGADDYGMRKYVMAFLKKGPNRDQLDSIQRVELQKGHMENIGRMAEEGKLALAGPFFGDGDLRGIYIFNVETIEEAEDLTNTDPAIQAGSLEMELLEWYGSAALMSVNELHPKLAKSGITE